MVAVVQSNLHFFYSYLVVIRLLLELKVAVVASFKNVTVELVCVF